MRFFQVPLALLMCELVLFAIFFHSAKMINMGKKFIQWSLKHSVVLLVEFVILTLANQYVIDLWIELWLRPAVSLFSYAVLLNIFQKNSHFRSKVAKHARSLLFSMYFLFFLSTGVEGPVISMFDHNMISFETVTLISLANLLVLFVFSLFINFLDLKYTV